MSVTEPSEQSVSEDTCLKRLLLGNIHCQGEDDSQARVCLLLPDLSATDE